jgi:nitrous oxidase accessory protein
VKSFLPIFLLSASLVSAETIVVRDGLERALGQAREGDTILLSGPEVFRGQFTVTKPLRILGTNSPVIEAGGTGTPLTIIAPNVAVQGVTFRNSGRDLANFDSAVMVFGSNARIENCRIENDGFGIYLRGSTNCLIAGNEIVGSRNAVSAARGNGIHLWKTKGNQITGNIIGEKRDGIYLSYADANVIASNRVTHSRFGIHYMYSHYNRLSANTLSSNAVGATLMFARHCVVEDNLVLANRRHGILLKQFENSRVLRNHIAGHNRGLFVQQAAQDRFEHNVIQKNDVGLYLSGGSEQNVFVGNAFIENTDQVWQPPDEAELGRLAANIFYEKRRGNYWSDYTGADTQHDGIGDTPYHETDVFGYIIDRHPEARIFALSPAVGLLRKGEELLPLLETTGVTDLFPLTKQNLFMPVVTRRNVQ